MPGQVIPCTAIPLHSYSNIFTVSTIELTFNLTKAKQQINVTISFAKNAFNIFQDYNKTQTDQLVFTTVGIC